jgi:hypothetical protein
VFSEEEPERRAIFVLSTPAAFFVIKFQFIGLNADIGTEKWQHP